MDGPEQIEVSKGIWWDVKVTAPAGHMCLTIFFKKNGVQVMYNSNQSSFLLQQWDERRAWAICQTMIDKAGDESGGGYAEDAKKRKRILQRFLKDQSTQPTGPLFSLIHQAWNYRQDEQKRLYQDQLRHAVKQMSPDEVEQIVAEAQIEDVQGL